MAMILVPASIAELRDHLVVMALSGPEMLNSHFPEQNRDTLFDELQRGLENLKKQLGDTGHGRLETATAEAKAYYELGDDTGGVFVLQHMIEYLRLKKYKTDEAVFDASRFQAH